MYPVFSAAARSQDRVTRSGHFPSHPDEPTRSLPPCGWPTCETCRSNTRIPSNNSLIYTNPGKKMLHIHLELSRFPSFQKKIRFSFLLVTRQRDGDLCPVLLYTITHVPACIDKLLFSLLPFSFSVNEQIRSIFSLKRDQNGSPNSHRSNSARARTGWYCGT